MGTLGKTITNRYKNDNITCNYTDNDIITYMSDILCASYDEVNFEADKGSKSTGVCRSSRE